MGNPSDGEVSRGEHVEADGAPDHEQYVRGLGVDKELGQFVAKAHKQREAAGEPRSAQAIWREVLGADDKQGAA